MTHQRCDGNATEKLSNELRPGFRPQNHHTFMNPSSDFHGDILRRLAHRIRIRACDVEANL